MILTAIPSSRFVEALSFEARSGEGTCAPATCRTSLKTVASTLHRRQKAVQCGRNSALSSRAIAPGGEANEGAEAGKRSVETKTGSKVEELEEVTRRWGLEAGLWKALRADKGSEASSSGSGTSGAGEVSMTNSELAKHLLSKYGGAYLATSITLSLISFSLFYALVDWGVDVPSLLERVGLEVDGTGQAVGTVALAYAAHKAASPIRFPPTVLLTPLVANLVFKQKEDKETKEN